MYRFTFFILLNLLMVFHASSREVLRYWNVSGASTMNILGSSNVNTFSCGSGFFSGQNVLSEVHYNGQNYLSGEIIIDVKAFDCQNRIMNNDFQNTLQADNYPEIRIEFLELKETSRRRENSVAEGWVEITIAGKNRRYPVVCEIKSIDENQSILIGKQIFLFSDFGLEPPQKAFGMVRVNNEITVEFKLKLDLVRTNVTSTR
jgi:hypothetical protein